MTEINKEKSKPNNPYAVDFNNMRINNQTKKLKQGIQPYFSDIEIHLVNYIEKATYVIGCVAWLTNHNITAALKNLTGVKIIINKEEYLNSNMRIGQRFYYKHLRERYDGIPDMFSVNCRCCGKPMLTCNNFTKIIKIADAKKGAILTCGVVNNYSKMHHKFLIFFDDKLEPTGLWTGSYNLSQASNYSLENAIYITDREVIDAYIDEFLVIYPYAEEYDWKSGLLSRPNLPIC